MWCSTSMKMVWFTRWLVGVLVAGAMLCTLPLSLAHAATFTVTKTADTNDGTCNSDCSLREAISAANASVGTDTITLGAGTYTLSRAGQGEDANAVGDLDIAHDLTITGAVSNTTIIDGGALDRVVQIAAGVNVTISNVTIRNGDAHLASSASDPGGAGIANYGTLTLRQVTLDSNVAYVENNASSTGGGVYNGGTLTVEHSRFTNNTAARGGAIFNAGTLTVSDSAFDHNSAHRDINSGGAIASVGQLTLTNSTLTNNFAENFTYHGRGFGGALDLGGATTLTGVTISGNTADGGGGISVEADANVSVNNSTLSNNTSVERQGDVNYARGGGVLNYGNLTVLHSTITNNQSKALYNTDGRGQAAGIYNAATLAVTSSTISNNNADTDGGGLLNTNTGTATITESTIDNNQASIAVRGANGGGIFNDGGKLSLTRSTVSNNYGFLGGGIANNGPLTIDTSTVSGNSAYTGSAINNAGQATIANSTIANNSSATDSGALSGATLSLKNTIVAFTTCGGPLASLGHNIDSGNTCGFNQASDKINTDPKLGPLANNGGPTLTHLPQSGSPAIDAGGTSCPAVDQRGVTRPQGPACDIGAVEAANTAPPVNIALSPATLPNGTVSQAYNQQLSATGGTAPYTFAVTNNSLPSGLTLGRDGKLSGTPTSAGSSTFTVTATDTRGNTGSKAYTLTISGSTPSSDFPNVPVLDTFNHANGSLGSNYAGYTGGYQIAQNAVQVGSGGDLYWKAQFGTSQAAAITLKSINTSASGIALLLKVQGGSTPDGRKGAIVVGYDPKAHIVQVATVHANGSVTGYASIPLTLANGDTFGAAVDAQGVVRAYKNGQIAATITLNAADQQFFNSKGGAVGVGVVNGSNTVFDDFKGGTAS